MGATTAVIGSAVLGWLFADLMTGFLHWIEDRFITARTPLVGKLIGAPNELHHANPTAFLDAGLVNRNWVGWLIVGLIALPLILTFGPSVFLLSAVLGGLFANEIHAFAHRKSVPAVVGALQQTGFWQSRNGHWKHHRTENSYYCVLSDWLNPWLELIGFWRSLDRLFRRRPD